MGSLPWTSLWLDNKKTQSTLEPKDFMNLILRHVFYSTTTEHTCKITLSHWLLLYHSLPPPIFSLSSHLRRCQQPLCSSRCRRSRSETPGSETGETITINIISNQRSLHKCVQGLHKSDDDECVWHLYLQKKKKRVFTGHQGSTFVYVKRVVKSFLWLQRKLHAIWSAWP